MLRALGAVDSTNAATLTLDNGGKPEIVTLPSVPLEHPHQQLPPAPQGPAPAWLAHEDVNYWHEARPEMDAWYAQFNQVRDADNGPTIAQWADTLRREMQEQPQRNLVLDLRHNNGGNNFLIWPIVRLVAWHEMSDPSHRTWVITGRGTFSACQDLVNFLDRATDATFVGEPSSSKPNFTGEDTRSSSPGAASGSRSPRATGRIPSRAIGARTWRWPCRWRSRRRSGRRTGIRSWRRWRSTWGGRGGRRHGRRLGTARTRGAATACGPALPRARPGRRS